MCGQLFPVQGRSVYCGSTCRQRAFRLRRRQANRPTLTHLTNRLRQAHRLTAQTVYECPSCMERFLSQRRCGDCNLMCRKVGLGGECASCAEILTIADLPRVSGLCGGVELGEQGVWE
jgi:ribosomal protein L32